MKIRLIREIRVLFFLEVFLVPSLLFSQLKNQIHVSPVNGSNYELKISWINSDSANLRVTTKQGHAVRNLAADDFLITRDEDTATIISSTATVTSATNDLAITFILDNSGSMFHSYDSLTKYLDRFIDSLGDGFIANAMTFDNVERKRTYDGTRSRELFIASSEFTQSRLLLKDFWHSYDSIRTELTPLYETIIKGLERISDRRKAGDSLRSEIIIVVTDGEDNASSVNIEKVEALASVMPVTLFTVNYRSDPDGRLLWLAKKTKGDHYVAEGLNDLRATLEYLRKEISFSYKLVYKFPFKGPSSGH